MWFGCNNGSDGIGNVLGTVEPAGTNWTFSYTIVSSDLPSMPLGWDIPTDYGMMSSAQFENVGAGATLSSKWFVNGVQISSNGGNINNQYAGRIAAMFTTELHHDEFLIHGHGHSTFVNRETRTADAGCWVKNAASFITIDDGEVTSRSWPIL